MPAAEYNNSGGSGGMDIRKAFEIIRNSILRMAGKDPVSPTPSLESLARRLSTPLVPPAEPADVPKFLEPRMRPAVILRRSGLPVRGNHPARSFFGGLPRLPPELSWPVIDVHEGTASPMFIAQIDLAEAPLPPDTPMPRSGTLFIFYDASNDAPNDDEAVVLYHPCAGNEFPERPPTHSVQFWLDGGWQWLEPSDDPPRGIGFKYPIEFVAFTSYCDYVGAENYNPLDPIETPDARELLLNELEEKLAHERVEPWPGYFHEAVKAAGSQWLFVWGVILHSARGVYHEIDTIYDFKLRNQPPEVLAELARLKEIAASWVQRAREHAISEPCDLQTQKEYDQVWKSLEAAAQALQRKKFYLDIRKYPASATHLVCNLCATESEDALARIPESFRKCLEAEARWDFQKDPRRLTRPRAIHQMLGYGESVQSGPLEHDSDVLLFQMKGDVGLEWFQNIGCVLQLWITPEALAKREFGKVRMGLECD
ncbi:hypothetical protein GCM10011487_68450 [Steroidobacter agaridevorans]|uniref:DUF1963 domain-containing protein n=2 Tax=Steroidobacter agaridevorans TaxID=2695856 RepID=A0A829YND4_9GAMM|nr:hypothetical protein GCM10011487_68450 [Steroidobacter agaridevorans]